MQHSLGDPTGPDDEPRHFTLFKEGRDWTAPLLSVRALSITCFGGNVRDVSRLDRLKWLSLNSPDLSNVQLSPLVHLRHLEIVRPITKSGFPADVTFLPCLEVLRLVRCTRLRSLPDIDREEDRGAFPVLKQLVMIRCSSLASLPSWLAGVTTLEELVIDACPALSFEDCDLSHLTRLRSLSINSCQHLTQAVVDTTAEIHSLTYLSLCSNFLKELPLALFELPELTSLYVSDAMLSACT